MTFVHEDREFQDLLGIVSRETGIAAALVEKDYWVTHTLWALHQTGLEIWFKGGTSLSKGFKLIQRFSEDLDLMILRGTVRDLPEVTNWTSTNKGPTRQRAAFYEALTGVLVDPDVRMSRARSVHSSTTTLRPTGCLLTSRTTGPLPCAACTRSCRFSTSSMPWLAATLAT